MKSFPQFLLTIAVAISVGVGGSSGEEKPATGSPQLSAGELRRSGTVRLEVTCAPEVKEDFLTALALLHSFFYDEARIRFQDIARRDPACAMAWWGVAMTRYQQLWAPPTPEEFEKGREEARMAKKIGGKTELERGFIDAVAAYFDSPETAAPGGPVAQTCHGPRQYGARALAYKNALERLRQQHPDNVEVNVFYALSLIGTAAAVRYHLRKSAPGHRHPRAAL